MTLDLVPKAAGTQDDSALVRTMEPPLSQLPLLPYKEDQTSDTWDTQQLIPGVQHLRLQEGHPLPLKLKLLNPDQT